MNRIELEKKRRENLRKLDIAYRPKINAVEVDIGNTFGHENAKFVCVWLIRKGIPASTLQDIIDARNSFEMEKIIEEYGQKFKHKWEVPCVVTEARFSNPKPYAFIQLAFTFTVDTVVVSSFQISQCLKLICHFSFTYHYILSLQLMQR